MVGQRWVDRHGQIHKVIKVDDDGLAWIEMIEPIKTRPMSQLPIPIDWTLL
jgi:hypothetical protein